MYLSWSFFMSMPLFYRTNRPVAIEFYGDTLYSGDSLFIKRHFKKEAASHRFMEILIEYEIPE